MSVDLSLPLKTFEQPLRNSIQELRRGYQSVSECLEQALAESEARGTELSDCRRQLAEARRSLTECERQLAERTRGEAELNGKFSALKKHFESKQAEWTQAAERSAALQAEVALANQRLETQNEHSQVARQQIEHLEGERQQWLAELTELRTQLATLTASTAEAGRLGAELAAAESQLAELRQELSNPAHDSELIRQIEQQQAAIVAFDAERAAWQQELARLQGQLQPLVQSAGEAARLAGQLEAAQAELVRMREQCSDQLAAALEQQAAEHGQQLAAWESEREARRCELAELRAQLSTLTSAAVESATLKGQLTAVEAERQRLREQLESGTPATDWQAQVDAYRGQIEQLQAERDAWRTEIGSLRGQLEQLTTAAVESATLQGKLTAVETERERLREQLETRTPATDWQAQVDAYRLQIEQLQAERDAWRTELGSLRTQMEQLTAAARDGSRTSDELAAAHDELNRLRAQLSSSATEAATFAELETYRGRVAALETERVAWRDELGQMREQVQLLTDMAATAGQGNDHLAQIQQELLRLREMAATPAGDEQAASQLANYTQQLESLQAERSTWGERLGQIQSQLASLTDTSEQAAELRDRLAAAEAELQAARQQAAAAPPMPDATEQLAAEQALREQLETELDALRLRGAELAEALDEQKRLTAAERDQWSEELRQLRRALERQTEFLSQRLAATAPAAPVAVPETPAAKTGNGRSPAGGRQSDAVVGTVLEQFEQLQKNKVRKLANSG